MGTVVDASCMARAVLLLREYNSADPAAAPGLARAAAVAAQVRRQARRQHRDEMSQTIDDLPTIPDQGDILGDGMSPRTMAAMAQEHGPIFKREFGTPLASGATRLVYMVGPDANKFVLHTHRNCFSNSLGWTPVLGPFFGKGLLNMDGDEWARHRKMMNPAFTAAYMAAYLPVINRVIRARTSDWLERGEVDLYEEAREIAFDVAAAVLGGLKTGAHVDELRRLFYAILHGEFDREAETWEQFRARLERVEAQLRGLLLPLIAARREASSNGAPTDVLGMMVNARDEGGQALSDDQLLAHANILLVAGHETTTTLASWLLYLLATHPGYLQRVHAELAATGSGEAALTLDQLRAMPALGHAVTEAGRLQSPVRFGPRGVMKEFEFAGYTIPPGTQVRYSIAAGHRLPRIFAEPDRFDPDRFAPPREEDKRHPYSLIIFGGGPRICIGVNLAQVEVKSLAAHVLRSFTLDPVPGHEVVQIGIITGFPRDGIRVRVHPRAPGAS